MRLFSSLAMAAFLPGFLSSGCGGGNTTVGAGGGGGSVMASSSASGIGGASTAIVETYCEATADAYCEAMFACCPDAASWGGNGTSVAQCKKLYGHVGSWCLTAFSDQVIAGLEAGHTTFNQATLDTCVAHLKAMAAGGDACIESPASYLDIMCMTAFEGQLDLGAPCIGVPGLSIATNECKDAQCDPVTHTCQPLAHLGELCADPDYPTCEDQQRLICTVTSPGTHAICVYEAAIGEPCTLDVACRSFHCDMTTGTCALPAPHDWLCGDGG